MADQCPKDQAVELLRRSRGPDAARQAEAVLPDPVDLRRDAALLVSLGLTIGQQAVTLAPALAGPAGADIEGLVIIDHSSMDRLARTRYEYPPTLVVPSSSPVPKY